VDVAVRAAALAEAVISPWEAWAAADHAVAVVEAVLVVVVSVVATQAGVTT